jgi:hypothetical protein
MIKSCLNAFKSWPRAYQFWFAGVLMVFWMLRASFSYHQGNVEYFHTDGSTEGFSIHAAKVFAHDGFLKTYLLPTYPPFGRDAEGRVRTEPFVYNHYLAGPDYVLGVIVSLLGERAIWLGRLVPLTLTVFALFLIGLQFARSTESPLLGCLILSLLMLPRSLTVWAINLYGHGYAMAAYLFLVGGLLWLTNESKMAKAGAKKYTKAAWAIGLGTGAAQMLFAMDWTPLTFLAGASFLLLTPALERKLGLRVLAGIFVGATAAFAYQLVISTLYFKSFGFVVSNFLAWGKWRMSGLEDYGIDPNDIQIHKIWQEFNKQTYGATGWTAMNLVLLSATTICLGFVSKVRNIFETKRAAAGLFMAWVAAVVWCFSFRQHALVHLRFINRHFFVLYMTTLLIALPILASLVERARASGRGKLTSSPGR